MNNVMAKVYPSLPDQNAYCSNCNGIIGFKYELKTDNNRQEWLMFGHGGKEVDGPDTDGFYAVTATFAFTIGVNFSFSEADVPIMQEIMGLLCKAMARVLYQEELIEILSRVKT